MKDSTANLFTALDRYRIRVHRIFDHAVAVYTDSGMRHYEHAGRHWRNWNKEQRQRSAKTLRRRCEVCELITEPAGCETG